MLSNLNRPFIALTLAAFMAVSVVGQSPPPEVKWHVLADVGPLPAPATCGCVTGPFKLTPLRPGWGYGSGPAAPDSDAPPSRFERELQRDRDRETRETLLTNFNDGIAGNQASSFSLALELTTGTALKRDDVEAFKWFLLAASQGHENAYVQLGHRYHRGLGVEQSDAAAAYWFYQAALRNDRAAMTALGGLYAAGRGVPHDWPVAVSWWQKAKQWQFVGDAYACGLGVAQDNERAVLAYQKGVDADDMSSAIQLGHMHAGGCAARADGEVALKSYEKAAQQGYPEAQVALSTLLLQGRSVPRDPLRAYFWAKMAELRLPAGDLRAAAAKRAAEAAQRLPPEAIAGEDVMVKEMIASGTQPMNK
jgi:TPR repeat protein